MRALLACTVVLLALVWLTLRSSQGLGIDGLRAESAVTEASAGESTTLDIESRSFRVEPAPAWSSLRRGRGRT